MMIPVVEQAESRANSDLEAMLSAFVTEHDIRQKEAILVVLQK